MRILITGSTGMIGSRLVKTLENTHTIVKFSRKKGMDIRSTSDCEKATQRVDVIIHAAAELNETKTSEEIWNSNVNGTRNIVEAAEKNDVKQFIFLSSVGVYGDTKNKLNEKSEMNPLTTYEKSKKAAEELVWGMQEVLPVTIIRPALVVGPNSYWEQIYKIVRKGFPLIGKGENAWQMIQVDELVDFIALCVGNEEAYNEEYVVAEKETHSLRDVVNMIADIQHVKHPNTMPKLIGMAAGYVFLAQGKLTGKKPILIPAHVKRLFKHREYDISKAMKLGWKPRYTTREALEKTFHELNENKT
jgi:nucleoside-diphosphate-sugar epimerase